MKLLLWKMVNNPKFSLLITPVSRVFVESIGVILLKIVRFKQSRFLQFLRLAWPLMIEKTNLINIQTSILINELINEAVLNSVLTENFL